MLLITWRKWKLLVEAGIVRERLLGHAALSLVSYSLEKRMRLSLKNIGYIYRVGNTTERCSMACRQRVTSGQKQAASVKTWVRLVCWRKCGLENGQFDSVLKNEVKLYIYYTMNIEYSLSKINCEKVVDIRLEVVECICYRDILLWLLLLFHINNSGFDSVGHIRILYSCRKTSATDLFVEVFGCVMVRLVVLDPVSLCNIWHQFQVPKFSFTHLINHLSPKTINSVNSVTVTLNKPLSFG